MDEGFIVDFTFGHQIQEEWAKGPPETSVWTSSGVKLKGKERRKVTTFCCPECGFLESYAEMERA
jgi:hypothetical protein